MTVVLSPEVLRAGMKMAPAPASGGNGGKGTAALSPASLKVLRDPEALRTLEKTAFWSSEEGKAKKVKIGAAALAGLLVGGAIVRLWSR